MPVGFFGDYDTTETVYLPFNTFDSNDPSASATITNLVAGDVHIHKDGGLTQRSSAAGVTVSTNFDGITGNHLVSIDLSDNTDAGFYANGSTCQVRIEGTTVDGATINAWIGSFSIGRMLRPTTAGRTLDVTATGESGVDLDNVTGTLTQANVGWVDANSRVDVGEWLGTAVTTSSTTAKPEVDAFSISNDATAANNAELAFDGTGYGFANCTVPTVTTVTNGVPLSTGAVDDIWDELLAGHVTSNSAGAILGTDIPADVGDMTSSAATGDPDSASSVMEYAKQIVNILVGTDGVTTYPAESAPGNAVSLAEVLRAVHTDVNSLNDTKVPDTISLANINAEVDTALSDVGLTAYFAGVESGTAQAGAAGTITLAATASASNDYYNDAFILITGGTGAEQSRKITDYVGSTKVATVTPNWTTNPDATSTYQVHGKSG